MGDPAPSASNSEGSPGIARSVLETLAASWGYIRARFELASLEGKEAAVQLLKAIGFVIAGLILAAFGWLFLVLAVVFLVATLLGGGAAWIWVTFGAAVLHLAGAVGLVWMVKGLGKHSFFEATLDEFRKDQTWLEARSAKRN